MGTFWMIAAAAAGAAIGHELIGRYNEKHGSPPLWFKVFMVALIILVIYLGMLSISGDPPEWMR
jgi:uncharacterized membrane protein SpoIIM required for sporulation